MAVLPIQGATAAAMKLCQSATMGHGTAMAMVMDAEAGDAVAHGGSHGDSHGDKDKSKEKSKDKDAEDKGKQGEKKADVSHPCALSPACGGAAISQVSNQTPSVDEREPKLTLASARFVTRTPATLDRPPRA